MKIPNKDIHPRNGGQRARTPVIRPSDVIPEPEWTACPVANNDWRADGQPYFARASLSKLVLPAVLYSLVMHASMKVMNLLPFASRLRIGVETLGPRDCFVPTGGEGEAGSVAVVTGSNTGVGFETASGLAEIGYHVVLACRSREKGEAAAERINDRLLSLKEIDGKDKVQHFVAGGKASFLHPLDLSSFASVRSFCKAYAEKYNHLNILVNNAGINSQGDVTEDGLEICFQSNFVGHFLLTKLLIDHLARAKNRYQAGSKNEDEAGRIVNLSSVTHHFAPANERAPTSAEDNTSRSVPLNNGVHDQHFWAGSAMPGQSVSTYRESKLAAVLFTMELNKRYGSRGIRSVSANPGSVSSDIWRDESQLTQKVYKMVYLNTKQGSSTSVAGAVGCIPRDACYLQPYWQPEFRSATKTARSSSFRRWFKVPFPMTEMLGPYVGHAITDPRLPVDGSGGYKSSEALWKVCDSLTTLDK